MSKIIAAILFIWAGLLLGVSFVATPAKFLAPSLPLAQALDVGRWTFHVLARIEWGFVALVAILLAVARLLGRQRIGLTAGLLIAIGILLAAQSFYLRPPLDGRVLRIMAGETVAPGHMHTLYIAFEAIKLALLLAAGIVGLRRLGDPIRA